MKDIAIIKTGDSIPSLVARRGDFEDWIAAGIGDNLPLSCTVVAVHKGETPPDFDRIGGIVVTGSHAMVTDREDWSEKTGEWLAQAVGREIPVLGICYGHQLLAHALGGRVGYNPCGPEFGTVSASLTADAKDDTIFRSLPRIAEVQTSHYQSVVELPPGATLLAFTEKDPHSAFRYGRCAWGVQFHPEYDADIANAYVREFNEGLKKSGEDVAEFAELPCDCRDTIAGTTILGRFADFVVGA